MMPMPYKVLILVCLTVVFTSYTNCENNSSKIVKSRILPLITDQDDNPSSTTGGSENESLGQPVKVFGPSNSGDVFSQDIRTGDNVIRFMIQVTGTYEEIEFTWFKDDVAIPDSNSTELIVSLTSAKVTDSAVYYAEVLVDGVLVKSAIAKLNVLPTNRNPSLPQISKHPDYGSNFLKYNQSETIEVFVESSSSTPQTYAWYRDGGAIADSNNAKLEIFDAKVSDSGDYYVKITNDVGEVTSSSITVIVEKTCVFPTSLNAIGLVRSIDSGIISGFAFDPSDICGAVTVEFWSDKNADGFIDFNSVADSRIGSVSANSIRLNLESLGYPDIGDEHGFSFPLPLVNFGATIFGFILVNQNRYPFYNSSGENLTFNTFKAQQCPQSFAPSLDQNQNLACNKIVSSTVTIVKTNYQGYPSYEGYCEFSLAENFAQGCGPVGNSQNGYEERIYKRRDEDQSRDMYQSCAAGIAAHLASHYTCQGAGLTILNTTWEIEPDENKDSNFQGSSAIIQLQKRVSSVPKTQSGL